MSHLEHVGGERRRIAREQPVLLRSFRVTSEQEAHGTDARHEHPDPSITPLLAAIAVGITLIWGIFDPIAFAVGGVLTFFALVAWGWPRREKPNTREIVETPQ